nr:hypothetical protein [uncultured Desulfobulbus sp.]
MRTRTEHPRGRRAARRQGLPLKKWIIVALALVLIGGGILYSWLGGEKENEYAGYLPQDVVATVNLLHLGQLSDTFAKTALGRFLAKDTVHAVIGELGGTSAQQAEYDQNFDAIAGVMTNPAFKAVFGDDATVALLPVDPAALQANQTMALRNGLVILARTTVAGALDLFSRMVKNAAISRVVVDELELTRVVLDPGQVLYGYGEGKMVLLAYDPATIKRCLRAADRDGHRLRDVSTFTQAVTYWQNAPRETTYCRLYVNPEALDNLLTQVPERELRQSAELLQGIDGLYGLTFAGAEGIESRARSTYRFDRLSPLLRSAVENTTHPNPTLSLVGENILAYSWASSFRPELITSFLEKNSLEVQQVDGSLRQLLGLGLDDLGKAFGPQYGGVLENIVRAALFPAPKMTLFLGLRDRVLAQQVVDALRSKIAENGMVREEQEMVGTTTLYCWPLLADKDAQPALAMTDSMLYLATSRQALKERLLANAAPAALPGPVAASLGKSLAAEIDQANSGSLVVYPRRMASKTGETLDWLAGILATTKNISLSRFNREMVRLMQSTELISATSSMGRGQADWSMHLRKARPQGEKDMAK